MLSAQVDGEQNVLNLFCEVKILQIVEFGGEQYDGKLLENVSKLLAGLYGNYTKLEGHTETVC